MISWKTAKCRYTKEFTDGTLKRVTESYLVNTSSITEAEAVIYKEVGEYVRGEFFVTAITNKNLADVFEDDDADKYYQEKVAMVTADADSGREKKIKNTYLVSAANVKEAYDRILECLKGLMATFEIIEIKESPIIDIFPFESSDTAQDTAQDNKEDFESPNINVAYAADEEE